MNKKILINFALVMLVISIVGFLLQAKITPTLMSSIFLGFFSLLAMVVVPIIFIRKQRQELGGVISFRHAFLLSFLGLFLGTLLSTIFSMFYVQFIDQDMGQRIAFESVKMTQSFLGSLPEEQQLEILRKTEADTLRRYTPIGMLQGMGYIALFYAIVSLILGAILKKKPMEEQYSEDEFLD